jgi:endonuclease YncB( thermonuclease family)
MSIRVYGVDSPELQKRKSDPPSQPFAMEAKDFTSNLVLGKTVRIKLLRKDQYGRAIAKVEDRRRFPPFNRRDVSLELVRNGFATIYTGGGAEYDDHRDTLEDLQAQAKKRKRGVWSLQDMVTPAEFKRQQKVLMKANKKI